MRSAKLALRPALAALLVVAAGCQSGPPLRALRAGGAEILNSQRIEHAFGDFGIEVLSAGAGVRVSNLYSRERGVRICRTFAVVVYPEGLDAALAEPHSRVVAGGSIGETFQLAGWKIDKRHRYFGEIESLGATSLVHRVMGLRDGVSLALHIYSFAVSRGGRALEYATIAEIHHPDYLRLEDLERLYGAEVTALSEPTQELRPLLRLVLDQARNGGGSGGRRPAPRTQ